MSTFTTNLNIQLIGTGEQAGTWGSTTNNNFQYVFEEAIVGRTTVSFSDANVTLTATAASTDQQYRNVYLNCTGTNAAQRSLIVPTVNKNYIVENNTTGGFAILVTTSGGTGIVVPNGFKAALYADGTNVVTAFNWLSALTTTTATIGTLTLTNALTTANGGTGLSSYTAGDLPYYASGTALSKLGIGASGYVLTSSGSAPQWTQLSTIGVTTFSGGTTGLTPASATSGAITLAGTLVVGNGGTGLTSLTAGYIPFGNGTSAFGSSANLFWDNTNAALGVGVTNPNTYGKLAVSGGNMSVLAGGILRAYRSDNATYNEIKYVTSGDLFYLNQANGGSYSFNVSGTPYAALSSTGLSVTGTTTSSSRFIVSGSSNAGTTDISYGSYSGGNWINSPSGNTGWLAIGGTGVAVWNSTGFGVGTGGGANQALSVGGSISLAAAGTTGSLTMKNADGLSGATDARLLIGNGSNSYGALRMVFNSTSNVSMDAVTWGSTSTQTNLALQVNGGKLFVGNVTGGATGVITTLTGDGAYGLVLQSGTYGVRMYSDSSNGYTIQGVDGTGSVSFQPLVFGAGGSIQFWTGSSGGGSTSLKAFVAANGSLNIGTSSSGNANRLTVVGSTQVSYFSGGNVSTNITSGTPDQFLYQITDSTVGNFFQTRVLNNSGNTMFSMGAQSTSHTANFNNGKFFVDGQIVSTPSTFIVDCSTTYTYFGYSGSNGSYRIQVNGQIFATSSTIATSDGRYKENVQDLTGALDLVKVLRPVSFKWKKHNIHNFNTEDTTVGFIAQEVQQAMADKPYLNSFIKVNKCTSFDEIEKKQMDEEFLGFAETNMVAILTKALQELNAKFDAYVASHP